MLHSLQPNTSNSFAFQVTAVVADPTHFASNVPALTKSAKYEKSRSFSSTDHASEISIR